MIELRSGRKEYVPNAPAARAADGRPTIHKKAKEARDSALAAERLQSSIPTCIADAQSYTVKREEKAEARWATILVKQDVKLILLRTNVMAKKRNTDLAFLMGGDPKTMDPEVRAWYMAERQVILIQIVPTAAALPSSTSTTTPPPISLPRTTPSATTGDTPSFTTTATTSPTATSTPGLATSAPDHFGYGHSEL